MVGGLAMLALLGKKFWWIISDLVRRETRQRR